MLNQLSHPTFRIHPWSALLIGCVGLAIASCSFRPSSTTSSNPNADNGTPEKEASSSPPSASVDVPAMADATPSAVPQTESNEAPDQTDDSEKSEVSIAVPSEIIEGPAGFILPSGNIYCLTYDQNLRCDMNSLLNPMPSQPDTCDLDWGGGVVLTPEGPTEVLCAGDTIAGNYDTLAYGTTWRNGSFECTSETVGLTCKNANEQGFFLSRERWEIFE